jgi:hypothetical protein
MRRETFVSFHVRLRRETKPKKRSFSWGNRNPIGKDGEEQEGKN